MLPTIGQDFEGQRLASKLMSIMLWSAVVVAVPVGLFHHTFVASLIVMVVAAVLTCIVVLPPWPMYNKHPLKYLPAEQTESEHAKHD